MTETPKYGLYVIFPEDLKPEHKHYIAAKQFCLVYTDKPPERCAEVTTFKKLKPEIKLWLSQQIQLVREEYAREHPLEVKEGRMATLKKWEVELEAEKEKLRGRADE